MCVGVDLRVFMIPKGESSCKAAVVDGNKGKKGRKKRGKNSEGLKERTKKTKRGTRA